MSEIDSMQHAEAVLFKKRQKWTSNRKMMFEALMVHCQPVSAYQLLELLQNKTGHRIDPPTIYRGLSFLQEMGLIVKVEGLNAFMVCGQPDHSDNHIFFVCNACGDTQEHCSDGLLEGLLKSATQRGFKPVRQIVELHGQCQGCRVQQ